MLLRWASWGKRDLTSKKILFELIGQILCLMTQAHLLGCVGQRIISDDALRANGLSEFRSNQISLT